MLVSNDQVMFTIFLQFEVYRFRKLHLNSSYVGQSGGAGTKHGVWRGVRNQTVGFRVGGLDPNLGG